MKVICVSNTAYPASLEVGKSYEAHYLPYMRLISRPDLIAVRDESGTEYIYPMEMFELEEKIDGTNER